MPEWVWIGIVVAGGALVITLVWLMLKIGTHVREVRVGKTAIVVHGKSAPGETPIGRALRYVPDNIGQITSLVYSHYLKIVKRKGVDPGVMTDIEDARFARSLIRFAVTAGNGTNSIQKIVETDIAYRDYDGQELETHIRCSVLPRLIESLRTTINSEYDTIARYAEYSERQRIVTQAEFVDMLLQQPFQDELVAALLPFYSFARRCLDARCKEDTR